MRIIVVFLPSFLITCHKFDNLLPELELSISVPFVLMLQIVHLKRLASDGWLYGIEDRFMTNTLFPWAFVEFWLPRFQCSDRILNFSDSVPDILHPLVFGGCLFP